MAPKPTLSIVSAVYQAHGCLPSLHQRLVATLEPLEQSFEILLIDDRSRDDSWEVIQEITAKDSRVRGFRMSRNFGQHPTITAGLSLARGDTIVVLDCDLEDPPEEIPKFLAKAEEGFDIVLGNRVKRTQGWWRGLFSRFYFGLLGIFGSAQMEGDFGSFSLLRRPVVDAYLKFKDRNRHYLFIVYWLGFRRSSVDYEQGGRAAGESSYTLRQLIAHAIQGVFFQSDVLLRAIVGLGALVSFLGVLWAMKLTYNRLVGEVYPGWTSVMVLILLSMGLIVTSLGIIGLYVAEVFAQAKERPLYVIAESSESSSTSVCPKSS